MIFATLIAFAQVFCWNGQALSTPTTASIKVEQQADESLVFTINQEEIVFTNPLASPVTNREGKLLKRYEYSKQTNNNYEYVMLLVDGNTIVYTWYFKTTNNVLQRSVRFQ
jgi:hypothetical protein